MSPKELERTIEALLQQPLADAELRSRLEALASNEISFSGFTWLFGPALYRRNRVLFRPFILSHFSTYILLPKFRTKEIRWKGDKAEVLGAWFEEVDQQDDAVLFRRLYEWKLSEQFSWRKRDARNTAIQADLRTRFQNAKTGAQRYTVLRKFDLWFSLDDDTARLLYEIDPAVSRPYILRRLRRGIFSDEPKRGTYSQLLALTKQKGDEDFHWNLYRRVIPKKVWTEECLRLCDSISDPAKLAEELERRHPTGQYENLAESFLQFLQRRGRDVFPYLMRHLQQVGPGWLMRGSYGKMVNYARERGWWDLWTALIRTSGSSAEFNKEIKWLLKSTTLPEQETVSRLLALAGVSREWNPAGFGVAAVHQLEEEISILFYDRFPDLLRGPFKLHIQSHHWGQTYSRLLDRIIVAKDEELIDFLASRIVTRSSGWGNAKKFLADAEKLADYYSSLKADEAAFSRRAANVLGQVPAYSIHNYGRLIRENRLARLLFERSAESYLADPRSLADLVEGAEIHVMALAYRALSLEDPRAREQAAQHLPLLLGTLLRPLHRSTRILGLGALANAASDIESASLVLQRAKDALNLPDKHYPKEKLLGLIAQILHRWPELRSVREQPVVYERKSA